MTTKREQWAVRTTWAFLFLVCLAIWLSIILTLHGCWTPPKAPPVPDVLARLKELPQFQVPDAITMASSLVGDPETIAHIEQIGYPCTGNNGVLPIIAPTNLPYAGEFFQLLYNLDYIPREPPEPITAWIWFAFQKDTFMETPLPLYLGVVGMTDAKADEPDYIPPYYMAEYSRGCRVYVGDGYGYFFPAGLEGTFGEFTRRGNAVQANIKVPNLTALFGLTIYTQMMVESKGANAHGHLTSNAVALTIGKRP